METAQDFGRTVLLLMRQAARLGGLNADVRIHRSSSTLRFDGFAGTLVLDRGRSGITVTLPRSDVVVYSSLIDDIAVTEKACATCAALLKEILSVLREAEYSM
jgi:hypothetical protein